MPPWNRDFTETIIDFTFRYIMFFGLSTHLYDRQARKLVYSPRGFVHSVALHVIELTLFPGAFKMGLERQLEESKKVYFFNKLFFVVLAINFAAIFVTIGRQWTTRAKAHRLFNEILKIWHKDVSCLQSNAKIRQTAAMLSLAKAGSTLLIMVITIFAACFSMDNSILSLALCLYAFMLITVTVATQYFFALGMIFGAYLFEILNLNLLRIVRDINCLTGNHTSRGCRRLSRELLAIGQLHKRVKKWVVSYKDLFQFELLLILASFFVSEVCTMFLFMRSGSPLWKGFISKTEIILLIGVGSTLLLTWDTVLVLYICGRAISSCNAAGEILRDLPTKGPSCKRLKRAIEMVCFELQREKIRLSICGLADVDGNTGFLMTEAVMMHILLLIQIEYD